MTLELIPQRLRGELAVTDIMDEKGKVIVLLTKDTRDVAFRWSAHHKQKKMHDILDKLKNKV